MRNSNGMHRDTHQKGYHPIRKIRIAMVGLKKAVILDFSVQYKLIVSVVFLAISIYIHSLFHFLFVFSVTTLMLVTEILNTVVETLCDYITQEPDEKIALIKDMAAGAAALAILCWWGVLIFVIHALIKMD